LQEMQESRAQAAADRQKLLERMRKQKAAPRPEDQAAIAVASTFTNLDIDLHLRAAGALRFMPLDSNLSGASSLNRPTLDLLSAFFNVLRSRKSCCILQWPAGQRDVSILHPLAMLSGLNAAAATVKTTDKLNWCEPASPFRTLYFPWRGGATSATQSLLVRRDEILACNKFHLTRHRVVSAKETPLDLFHLTIGHLGRLRQRETTKPHLAHPTLAEMYPVFAAEGGDPAPRPYSRSVGELFSRVRFGAALDQLTDHRPTLSNPTCAPFGFFGICTTAKLKAALTASALSITDGIPPDIGLLDLGAPALNRLGHAWQERVEEFIVETRKRFSDLPFLAITHDPFVHRRVATLLRGPDRSATPTSSILVRVSRDCLAPDPLVDQVTPTEVTFSSVAGPTSDAIAALSEAARECLDPSLAGTLRREMGSLRKAASLPCGLTAAYSCLVQEIGQYAAEIFLEYRSRATLIAPINEALASEIGGTERAKLTLARDMVARAFDALDLETPIGSLLSDLAVAVARKSSRAIIAFSSSTDKILGVHRLADDSDAGRAIRRRLANGHIVFTTAEGLDTELSAIEKSKDRNTWKRLILVAPSHDWLSAVSGRPWLPEELIVVCERNLAARVGEIYQRLASHPDLTGPGKLGERLATIAEAAKREVAARGVESVDLELEPKPKDRRSGSLIDLTDDDLDEGDEVILLSLTSGRKLRARPRSAIIRYNQNAEFNPFERSLAREIRPREVVVVADDAFVLQAREVLPLRVLAQSWVNVYHATVEASLAALPGDTLSAKARHVLSRIGSLGARTQSHAAVNAWLRVAEYKQLPPEKRQPHAPQRRREFDAFMAVLGVNDALAEKMWLEGIQPLRIDRRRAGQRMAQAFVSVLVDPHGTASGFDEAVRQGIRALRKRALDHLDQVTAIETLEVRGGDE
jgi:hypothetical protein